MEIKLRKGEKLMANKDWWEDFSPADCLKTGSWEDMADYIQHSACTDFTIYSECTIGGQAFRFTNNGALSTLVGGADTGDALKIIASDTDTYPFIRLEGDDYIELKTTNDIYFYEQAEQMFKFSLDGSTSIICGSDDAGDNLEIFANNLENCALIKLYGNAGIVNKIKAASVFEVSTCTDETLFEIDSTVGHHHMEFHCLDAHDFVLENRTDDPGSPCVGQIWFRTDLV